MPHDAPAPQALPPVASQHRCPTPPHATQKPFTSTVYGAVQATSPWHAGWPSRPQVPDWQPPAVHVPWLLEHIEPAATHSLLLLSQQPPAAQPPPAQHGWPGPPHAVHWLFCGPQVRPPLVQKSFAAPPPWQQFWPEPPQVLHAPAVQVPRLAPHVAPDATQVVPAQQPPAPQVEFSQHGWPVPPHAVRVPLTQSWPPELFAPAGTHRPLVESRHAPPLHVVPPHAGWRGPPHGAQMAWLHTSDAVEQVVPPQQGWPAPPQPAHCPVARQRSPRPQLEPEAMQRSVPWASQQPAVQFEPAHPVGFDSNLESIVVGSVTNTHVFHFIIYTSNGSKCRVNGNNTNLDFLVV